MNPFGGGGGGGGGGSGSAASSAASGASTGEESTQFGNNQVGDYNGSGSQNNMPLLILGAVMVLGLLFGGAFLLMRNKGK